MINWDANATYGLSQLDLNKYQEILQKGLNPSSIHYGGQFSRAIIEECRELLAKIIIADKKDKIIFTSGATEANNSIIRSVFQETLLNQQKFFAITTAIEHPSILEPLNKTSGFGSKIISLKPNPELLFESAKILEICKEDTMLLCIMYANNETGQILPVKETAAAIKNKYPKIHIHVDGVQALGKAQFSFQDLNIDSASFSAHKVGGFPGVGALVLKDNGEFIPLVSGGPQETKFRAGTENWIGIASFRTALERIREEKIEIRSLKMRQVTDKIIEGIKSKINNAEVLFENIEKLPNTISVRFKGIRADDLIVAADLAGLYLSTGSACSSGKVDPSPVLLALGLSEEDAKEVVRISIRGDEQEKDIIVGLNILSKTINNFSGQVSL